MSFLTVPSQKGLFTTIKADKSEEDSRSPVDEEDNDDEDDDDTENVHLIPRCSPVPRKRGASIHDETAEYMRIQALSLSGEKRVSFADTTGGDLTDVKEFVAFDSDDEEGDARWEEEQAKYRKPERDPVYHVHPEFNAPSPSALLQAVHTNKVEVEEMSPVEDEPLAFSGVIRVLNISFHKAVYIRSTMDHWATYFDHPAEYVQGSHDGDTDKFTFKLSFAPPYVTHGSRIEFVVRYETSDGDYWANNRSMNYVVTLHLSYEDDSAQKNTDMQEIRGILRPPKDYSMVNEFDSEEEEEEGKDEDGAGTSRSGLDRSSAACPAMQCEIDVEIAVHPSGPSNQELPSVDGTLSIHTVAPGGHLPLMSSETTPQTNVAFVLCTSVQPNMSEPSPSLHSELGHQTSEQPLDSKSPSKLLHVSTSSQQESRLRSDRSQAAGEEIPAPDSSCLNIPELNPCPTGEYGLIDSLASRPCPEPPAEFASAPSVTQSSEQEVAVGLSEVVPGLSTRSAAAYHEGSTPAHTSPVAETQPCLGAEGEAPPSPELTESTLLSAGVTEVSQNTAPQSACEKEKEDALQSSPDALLENLANTEAEPQSEHNINRNLMPTIIGLSGVVSLSIVLQQPSALFLMGLLLVLHRL